MFRGIEIAASGMASIIDLNDIIANNMANVNTPGFKKLTPTFKSIHDQAINGQEDDINGTGEATKIGSLSMGSSLDSARLDFSQGALNKTDGRLDVALNGEGFFVVQTKSGEECYTRNGGFTLDEEGNLMTRSGDKVLDESGQAININIAEGRVSDIDITEDGRIMLKKEEMGRLKVVNFEDTSSLQSKGNSLFSNVDENNKPKEMEKFSVSQGFLESSNANVVESMINSITGARMYETLSKVIQNADSTYRKSVTDVGRVMQ